MAKKDTEYQLTEKGRELADKASQDDIKKDELMSSIVESIVNPTSEKESAKLIRELKEVDKKIAEAKRLEKEKKKEVEKTVVKTTTDGEVIEAGQQKHGMGYKRAKDIRKKSFGSLLAEQEGGLFSSLSKTLSLKTQAKMTGIKESLDPLNIAKKITLGSNWAPAMLGKLTGRSKEDTGYFSNAKNRTSHVSDGGNTATKVGSIEHDNNLNAPLMQILALMQQTNEADIKRKQQENQQKEIIDAKRDKRHKELLAALTGKGGKTAATKIKDAPSDYSVASIVSDIVNTLGGLKTAMTLFGTLGTIFVGGTVASWFAAAVTADPNFQKAFTKENDPYGMLGAMSGDSALGANIQNVAAKSKEEKASIDAKNAALNNLLADAPVQTRLYQVGAREYLMEKKGLTESQVTDLLGPKSKGAAELRKEEKETATKLQTLKEKPIAQMSLDELKQVKDSIVQYGDPRYGIKKNPAAATPKELATAKQLDTIDAAISAKENEKTKPASEPTPTVPTKTSTATPEAQKTTAVPTTATPTATESPATSKALIGATDKNLDMKLEEKSGSLNKTSVVTTNNSTTTKLKPQAKVALPSVRNQEDTFQRMILNSTRIV